MDHHHGGFHGNASGSAAAAAGGDSAPPVQWPLLAGIAAGSCVVCLASTLLPCVCLRLANRAAAAKRTPEETPEQLQQRLRRHQSRVATVTGCLTSIGAGVILATCFIGLMPAAASAYVQLCATNRACLAAVSLVPNAGCLAGCLVFWLIRSLIELARSRRSSDDETKPLVAAPADDAAGGSPAVAAVGATPAAAAAGCCADAASPSALQDWTTASFITAALMLKAIVEGLALPSMLRVASPLFLALGKCLHEACCSLVLGLAWCDTMATSVSSGVGRWGLVALVAYSLASSGSILLGGLTASLHTVAGAAVQFALLVAAAGAALQASFVHILPRLPAGPASPALTLAGMLLMALVAAMHHAVGGHH